MNTFAVKNFIVHLADAHRPAMDQANETGLPMTVFSHPDWGFSNANTGASILSDKKTKLIVTWLPDNFFMR